MTVEGIEGVDYVIAPHAVADPELERKVYGAGDRVPMEDAIKYGLVTRPAKKAAAKKAAAKSTDERAVRGPAEDRAKKPSEDR